MNRLWTTTASPRSLPLLVFNGELDRVRSGYYPALFYPRVAALAKTFLPHMETAYYIHNFKESTVSGV